MRNYFQQRMKSISYALQGMKELYTESNMKVHTFCSIVVILLGCRVHLTKEEWLWIISAIILVFFGEAVNTAIERLCDAVDQEHNEHIKHTKDIAATAVLFLSILAVIIGIMVFYPYIT